MNKRLLYLFGEPGTGKITVARILQKQLGWRLFWLHDLDEVCQIVGRYPLPRLMDRISAAVLDEMMDDEQPIIYVRPSRDKETIARIVALAGSRGYRPCLVRLWACYGTLVDRVERRGPSTLRISTRAGLDTYLSARPLTSHDLLRTHMIDTGENTPEWIADRIVQLLSEERTNDREHVHHHSNRSEAAPVSG